MVVRVEIASTVLCQQRLRWRLGFYPISLLQLEIEESIQEHGDSNEPLAWASG